MDISKKYFFPWHFPLRKELAGIIIILLIFLFSPQLIRMIDATASAIDPGTLSAILLAIAAVLIFQFVTWWVLTQIWPLFAEYSNLHFERNFKSLLPWQKVGFFLGFYSVLLYSFIVTLQAIL